GKSRYRRRSAWSAMTFAKKVKILIYLSLILITIFLTSKLLSSQSFPAIETFGIIVCAQIICLSVFGKILWHLFPAKLSKYLIDSGAYEQPFCKCAEIAKGSWLFDSFGFWKCDMNQSFMS